jgi:hypothetical protein
MTHKYILMNPLQMLQPFFILKKYYKTFSIF